MGSLSEELLATLKAATSFEDVVRQTTSDELAATLDRCAWVRSFDEDVFAILRADAAKRFDEDAFEAAVTFENVTVRPEIERVPKREGSYRVRPDVRDAAMRRLARTEPPGSLRALSGALAEHFHARRLPHDELDQLIVADPAKARALLLKLYDKAEADFDVLRCRALLDLVCARDLHQDWQLTDTVNDLERYLTARTYWRGSYRKAARFYRPPEAEKAFVSLLADEGPQTLLIVGENGLGKSIHLLDLITRLAVTKPHRLSCALVDFSLMQVGNVQRNPWLVLVEIAHQLNQQLDEPLFDEFLRHYGRLRARVLRPQIAIEASVQGQLPDSEDELDRLGGAVRQEFFCVIEPSEVARRVLLAFDGLERLTVVAAAGTGKRRLLEELVDLRGRVSEMRMVFAGQSTPEIEEGAERFEPYTRLELHRLGPAEARTYLISGRKLDVGDDVIDAALEASGADQDGATPLRLAMIADAIERWPNPDPDVVRTLDEPALFILIEQIVVRIADIRARWVLRYGVIPRLLTREFMTDVLAPLVAGAIHGTSADDDPSQDPSPSRLTASETPFPTDPDADVGADELWEALLRSAADSSWIEPVDTDALRFHETVLEPMREVLRAQPVFKTLHRAASRHFEEQAEREPDKRARLRREAFYHELQLDAEAAIARWQQVTRSMATDPEVAAALAEELLNHSRCAPDVVGPELVAEARVERALANLRRATAPGAARGGWLWDLAREDITAASVLGDTRNVRLVAGRAALLIRDGAIDDALGLVEPELKRKRRPEDAMILHVRAGDAYAERDSELASTHYVAALALGRETNGRPEDLGMLLWKHASVLARRDDVVGAGRVCEECLALAPEGSPAFAAAHLLRGQLLLRQGDATAAVEAAAIAGRHGGRIRHEAALLRVRAALAVGDDEVAGGLAEEALLSAREREDNSAEAGIELAEAYELRADARVARLDVRGAQADLEEAAKVWNAIAGDGVARCFATMAQILMRQRGSRRRADLALQRAEGAGSRRLADRAAVGLGRAEWTASNPDGTPKPLVEDVLEMLRESAAARGLRAQAALAGLCLPDFAPQRAYLQELLDAAGRLDPPIARLTLLDDLARCPSLESLHEGDVRKLRALLAPEKLLSEIRTMAPPEQRALLVRVAHVARVTGQVDVCRKRLAEALALEPALSRRSLAHRRLRLAAELVGDEALLARLGPSEKPETIVAEHAALDTPSTYGTVEKLLPRDVGMFAAVLGGIAVAGAVGWARWRKRAKTDGRQLLGRGVTADALASELVKPEIRPVHPTIEVLLRLEGDRVITRVVTPGETSGREHAVDAANPVVAGLVGSQNPATAGDAALGAVFTDPEKVGLALAELLFEPALLTSDQPLDIRLWAPDALLGQVPWELARWRREEARATDDPRVRHLYRGVLDAAQAPEKRRTPTRKVLIVRPRADGAGAITTTLVNLEDAYEAAGMQVEVLESALLPQISDTLRRTQPDVLHISGGLVNDGVGVAIDVGGGVAGETELPRIQRERMTTTGLALALAAVPPPGPEVILDPPAVRHVAVYTSQLLLRNAFATDLASATRVPAVIGTGHVRGAAQDALYAWLRDAFAAGLGVAATADGIRTLKPPTRSHRDALGLPATALFAVRPGLDAVAQP